MTNKKKVRRVGVILNGVTGRMGTNQHLMQSMVAIMNQGGLELGQNEFIMPDPILVGRDPAKLKDRSKMSGVKKWTTEVDEALDDPQNIIYFDSQTTIRRVDAVRKAVRAGKHVYCEKPTASSAEEAYELYKMARDANVKHGVVQDKLWLPGIQKLKALIDDGVLGEVLAIRGEFGYWVFEGDRVAPQRPSWNYRKEDGGGIILDMFPHWCYLLENLFGKVLSVSCTATTHVKKRWDEEGNPYDCTAEDAAYATFRLESGIIAHFNSSWATRVRRDDLLTVQVDGTEGSAVAGLHSCFHQSYGETPKPVWDPEKRSPINFLDGWIPVSGKGKYENPFKAEWELFLKHVVRDEPFSMNFLEGAKGVLLAETGVESWKSESWVDVPELKP